jgi:hypothetical protein
MPSDTNLLCRENRLIRGPVSSSSSASASSPSTASPSPSTASSSSSTCAAKVRKTRTGEPSSKPEGTDQAWWDGVKKMATKTSRHVAVYLGGTRPPLACRLLVYERRCSGLSGMRGDTSSRQIRMSCAYCRTNGCPTFGHSTPKPARHLASKRSLVQGEGVPRRRNPTPTKAHAAPPHSSARNRKMWGLAQAALDACSSCVCPDP